ncbi:unnamed protein product [Calypogeia fissa]
MLLHFSNPAAPNMSSVVLPATGYPAFRGAYSLKQFRGSISVGSLGGHLLVYDECQRAVLAAKTGHGNSPSGGGVDVTFQSGTGLYILGLDCQRRKEITFHVHPYKRKSHLFARVDGRDGKRALNSGLWRWRSEFRGATEVKRSSNFKSVNAPAKFASSPQKQGSHCGSEVRGQQDDFTAVTLAGNGLIVSPEVHRAKAKVVGAGAGASAILNFCQQSSLLPTAQFWYSSDVASEPVLLSDMELSKSAWNGFDDEANNNTLITQESNGGIVFLVLGVGTGVGLGTVPQQLKAVRSRGCLAVGIFIQPFMFEGPKRLEQANQLIDGLLGCTDILLVVEQDGLLRRDIVTVSEASTLAKNAVLLSIKTIAELLSVSANVSLDTKIECTHATPDDTMKILQHAGKAWLGSGKGGSSREAIEMAVAEAPVSDYRPFGAKRLVLCTVASSIDQSKELNGWKSFLHQTLGPELQLIISTVRNPMLENNVKLATIIIVRVNNHQVASGISDDDSNEYGLPSMIGINTAEQSFDSEHKAYSSLGTSRSPNSGALEGGQEKTSPLLALGPVTPNGSLSDNDSSSLNQGNSVDGTKTLRPSSDRNLSPQRANRPPPHRSIGKRSSAYNYRSPIREDIKSVDARLVSFQAPSASAASQKLRLAWEAGPSSDIAEAWAQARAEAREPAQVTSGLDLSLPVGVRVDLKQSFQATRENYTFSAGVEVAEDKWSGKDAVPVDPDALPRNRMMDMGLEAVRDMYNAASALVMGRDMNDDRRQASLSQRAASMLESERSQKKLTPLVEMGFKNGIYKGRCHGGLPEGKGRLSFSDGSFYDGQWRQGKRAGSGAFYYSNGDMFQGSWKDDVMHGKGWMYYYNGDRLYANFWKGRADGEGRFYSAQGDVFFGQFRENWRHGEFLYIEASGVRWAEIWENGILQSRSPADG